MHIDAAVLNLKIIIKDLEQFSS